MKTVVDRRLVEQARVFELRFACEDCAHFHEDLCTLGYPAAPRRHALASEPSRPGVALEFCKSFELA